MRRLKDWGKRPSWAIIIVKCMCIVLVLYLLLPWIYVRMSENTWIQDFILGKRSASTQVSDDVQLVDEVCVDHNSEDRAIEIRSLWESLTIPVFSILLSFGIAFIAYAHQRQIEREKQEKECKKWLEEYFADPLENTVNITEEFNDSLVKLKEENDCCAWGFLFSQKRVLPLDSEMEFRKVSIAINDKNTKTFYPDNKGMRSRHMSFALFSGQESYDEIKDFAISAKVCDVLQANIEMKVCYEGNTYDTVFSYYIIKKRDNVTNKLSICASLTIRSLKQEC